MEQARKQRLVGTVVLIALAVIFVPMILDFSRVEDPSAEDIQAPPAPDVNKMQVLPLDVWSQKIDPEIDAEPVYIDPEMVEIQDQELDSGPLDEQADEADQVDQSEQVADDAETTVLEQSSPEQEASVEPTSESAAIAPVQAPKEPKKVVLDTEALQQAKADQVKPGRAWTVQLVSVSRIDKAMAFRQELQDKGYVAYVTEAKNNAGQSLYRVRVGPEQLKSKAEALKKRLKTETGIDGLLMRY